MGMWALFMLAVLGGLLTEQRRLKVKYAGWRPIQARILGAQVVRAEGVKIGRGGTVHVRFQYQYSVAGQTYQGQGRDGRHSTWTAHSVDELHRRHYQRGMSLPIYVNPHNPAESWLPVPWSWTSFRGMLAIIALFNLVLFLPLALLGT